MVERVVMNEWTTRLELVQEAQYGIETDALVATAYGGRDGERGICLREFAPYEVKLTLLCSRVRMYHEGRLLGHDRLSDPQSARVACGEGGILSARADDRERAH